MMRRFVASAALVLSLITLTAPLPVAAGIVPSPLTQVAACSGGDPNFLNFEPWHACLQKKYGSVKIGSYNDVWLIVVPLFDDTIKAAGYVAAGFIIWGGVKYIKSNGDPNDLAQAKDVIRNASVGLVVCILSVTLVQYVAQGFIK
jgi:hypothetical protein